MIYYSFNHFAMFFDSLFVVTLIIDANEVIIIKAL